MPELRLASPPPPDERHRALRHALGAVVTGWRPLAQHVLGADERIDWVGRDGDGRAVIALVGQTGEDLALVARGLAQLDWVAARVADWAQLAPDAGLRPEAGALAVLLAPHFQPAAIAATRSVSGLRLVLLRFVENGTGVVPLLELVAGGHPPSASAGSAAFRTGLSPADLDLTPEERAEFSDSGRVG